MLVTGAAGFLGSHVCDALVAEGHSVVGVDNFCTGRAANLEHLKDESRFSVVERDICVPFDLGPVDFVFNFASPASPVDYMRLGIETLRVGSEGTKNALEVAQEIRSRVPACFDVGVLRRSDRASAAGRATGGNVNPIGPRSVYDEAKRFSEALVMAYHRYYKVDTRLVRIFNTYGPRLQSSDGRVISNLMTQALHGEDLTIYGDGSQTRSFCYVSDEVEGILRLSRSEEHLPVNIGNPEEWTILECARQVLEVTGSKSRIRFEPLPQDDPVQRRPDITKARRLLGWEPKIDLRMGLQLCLEYFRQSVERGEKATLAVSSAGAGSLSNDDAARP